jgi:hypothetical protein
MKQLQWSNSSWLDYLLHPFQLQIRSLIWSFYHINLQEISDLGLFLIILFSCLWYGCLLILAEIFWVFFFWVHGEMILLSYSSWLFELYYKVKNHIFFYKEDVASEWSIASELTNFPLWRTPVNETRKNWLFCDSTLAYRLKQLPLELLLVNKFCRGICKHFSAHINKRIKSVKWRWINSLYLLVSVDNIFCWWRVESLENWSVAAMRWRSLMWNFGTIECCRGVMI